MKPLLIKNGEIVNADETIRGDVRIEGGRIVEIGSGLSEEGAEVIDADGCFVVPGGVDVHTHLNLDTGTAVAKDDFFTGTLAAAFGGTTTVVDHPGFGPEGCGLRRQVEDSMARAKENAVIDYAIHGVFQHVDDRVLKEIAPMTADGIASFKAYLTYGGRLEDGEILQVIEAVSKAGGLLAVHAENDAMIRSLQKKILAEGKTAPKYHALSRPPECEAEAVGRMINLAAVAGAPLYIVHLSTALGLEAVKAAKKAGQVVFAETCPQYLLLDDSRYEAPDGEGVKYIMSPPLRKKSDCTALWQGIGDGVIDVVATDHCPFDFSTKLRMGKKDFTRCPGGLPGIELRVPLMFSEGVGKGRMNVQRFVELVSEKPAKIMGLFPKKGVIASGSDGDVVIIDPKRRVAVTQDLLHENVDYTPYEGMELTGWPVCTIAGGRVVVREGEFFGEKGRGQLIRRRLPAGQIY